MVFFKEKIGSFGSVNTELVKRKNYSIVFLTGQIGWTSSYVYLPCASVMP
jgi:hypothetical protein